MRELCEDPVLVSELFISAAEQVEDFDESIRVHVDLSVEKSGLETLNVDLSIFVDVCSLELFYDHLAVLCDSLQELLKVLRALNFDLTSTIESLIESSKLHDSLWSDALSHFMGVLVMNTLDCENKLELISSEAASVA